MELPLSPDLGIIGPFDWRSSYFTGPELSLFSPPAPIVTLRDNAMQPFPDIAAPGFAPRSSRGTGGVSGDKSRF
jgi:hypothetical protein